METKPEDIILQAEKKEVLQAERITLMPQSSRVTFEEIFLRFGEEQKVIVCDLYIDTIESEGAETPYGLDYKNITNIDHHAPIRAMERPISSATLAIEYVNTYGPEKDAAIAVNHTDCDSALSSAIMRGSLPPDQKFSDAAIAADHTGEPNDIADLLQSLDAKRDLDFSLRNLKLLLNGEELEPEAQELLEKRLSDRERARTFVESGAFKFAGGVAYATASQKFDGAFLPGLLPDSAVILLCAPLKDKDGNVIEGKSELKVRLGKNTPPGVTLHSLGLKDTALKFGGRWNAGSNNRAGGTSLSIEEAVEIVVEKLASNMSL